MAIQSFPNFKLAPSQTFPGICAIWYVPVSDVDFMAQPISNNIIQQITLLPEKNWFKSYFSNHTSGAQSTPNKTLLGINYLSQINGIYPRITHEVTSLFQTLSITPCIVIAKLNTGNFITIGSKRFPAQFEFVLDIPDKPEKAPFYSFQFFCSSDQPIPLYLYGLNYTEHDATPPTL